MTTTRNPWLRRALSSQARFLCLSALVGLIAGVGSCVSAEASPAADAPAAVRGNTDADTIRGMVYAMERAYADVHDYAAVFHKRERIRGRMLPRENMQLKFRRPFSVYLRWLDGKKEGQESLFVKGWNDDKIRAHPGSFPDITVSLRPTSSLAMRGNRHPITEVGIGNMIALITRDVRRSERHPEDDVTFVDLGHASIHGQRAHCVEAVMPAREDSGYYAHRARVCISERTGLPIGVVIWDHDNELIEDYSFSDLRINTGLTAHDFDPDNPAYDF